MVEGKCITPDSDTHHPPVKFQRTQRETCKQNSLSGFSSKCKKNAIKLIPTQTVQFQNSVNQISGQDFIQDKNSLDKNTGFIV